MRIFFLFLLFLNISLILGQDVCVIQSKMLTSNIESNIGNPICEKSFCQGNYSFKCGANHCSTNVKKCFEFIKAKQQAMNQLKMGSNE
jgi:hypothetical protein